jgi:CHAD domain-containing protein
MKVLEQFAEKRCKRLRALLKAFPAGKEKEELHQIRLEIKKIKALLRLVHFNDKEFRDHKHFVPFRSIFRETGKIRDTVLRKELLDQYTKIHTPFFRSPERALNHFIKMVPTHLLAVRKQKKILLKEVAKIKSHTYTLYLDKKNKELTTLLEGGITQKDLHGLRKLIKEIIYLTSVKNKDKIDPFLLQSADLIGNWHDKKILIPWIRIHAPKEKATIKRLQAECNTDMQNLRNMVGGTLKFKAEK